MREALEVVSSVDPDVVVVPDPEHPEVPLVKLALQAEQPLTS